MQTDKNQRRTMRFIGFSFLSLVIVLILVCVFSYIRDKEAQYSNDEKMQVAYQRLELVNELFSNRELSQMLLRTHIHTEGAAGKDSLRHLLQQAHLQNRANIKNLEKLLVKPRRKELLHNLSDEQNAYYRASDSLLVLSNSGNTAAALAYLDAVLAPLYNHHQTHLISLNKEATISSRRRMDEVISSISSVVDRYALMILLAAVSTAWAAFALNRVFRHLHRENNVLNGEIRERKALQAALVESQQLYRRLFDSNPIPMLVYDQHTLRIMEVNEATLQEYGYTRSELLNMTVADIRPPEDIEAFLQRIGAMDKAADGTSKGFTHQRKDGSRFKVELWSHALPQQHDVYPRLVVAVNVQERETVIEQLAKQEEQLREVSSSIPGAVYQFVVHKDKQNSIPFISEGVINLCGISPQQVYSDPAALLATVHPNDVHAIKLSTDLATQALKPWLQEYRVWSAEQQKWKWVRGHGLPTLKENGDLLFNGTLIDITDQKEAQAELVSSRAELRALLDSSPQAIYLLDEHMHIVSFNKVAATEVKRNLLLELRAGQNVLDYVTEEQRESFRANHAKAMQGETVLYQSSQGDSCFEIAFRPVLTSDKEAISVALSLHDISEQKKAIDAIKKNESQLARAQQLVKIGNWELDIERNVLTMSRTLYDIYGVSRKTFTPTFNSISMRFHPKDREKTLNKYAEVVENGKEGSTEHRIVLDNGTVKHLYQIMEPVFDHDGQVIKVSGTTQDITERKAAEREITQAKNLLQSTLENIPEIIFSTDTQFNILYISPQCLELTGYKEEELIGHAGLWEKLLHQEDTVTLKNTIAPRLISGEKVQHEMRVITKDGESRWMLFRHSPLINPTGIVTRIDSSAADITERKMIEAKRTVLTEQLQTQNENLQQFAYIVSHNLRAPIANILGLTTVLNQDKQDPGTQRCAIENLARSARSLDGIIRDLNELLTVRGQIQNTHEHICFEELVKQVLAIVSHDITTLNAKVEYEFSDAPQLYSLKSYVQSIIFNLVSNALKYRSPARNPHIKIKTFRQSSYICLSISDNGLGIDLLQNKDKLFGLYKRFHPGIEGRGVGLHLVKTQAEILGGKVEVDSQVNKGTIFRIYFKSNA